MIANNDSNLPSNPATYGSGASQQLVIAKPLARESETQQALPIDSLLSAFRRRWKLALPLGLVLAVAGAAAAWVVFKPEYTAKVYLRVRSELPTKLASSRKMKQEVDFSSYKSTLLQSLSTPFVLNGALQSDEVQALPEIQAQPDPLTWLSSKVNATFPNGGEFMLVSLTSGSADASVTLINAVMDSFREEIVEAERRERLQKIRELSDAYDAEFARVGELRRKLRQMSDSLGASDADSLSLAQRGKLELYHMMRQHLFTLTIERQAAESKLEIAKQKRREFDDASPTTESEMGSSTARPKSSEELRLELEISRLKIDLRSKYATTGSAHPAVVRLKREIESREAALREIRAEVDRVAAGANAPGPQPPISDQELLMLERDLKSKEANEKSLTSDTEDLFEEVETLGISSEEADNLRKQIAAGEEFLHEMFYQLHHAEIEYGDILDDPDGTESDGGVASRVDSWTEAKSATATDPKKRIMRAGALGLAGLFGPLTLLMIWDLSRRNVDNEESVTRAIAYTNLGTIPFVPSEPLLLDDKRQTGRRSSKYAELSESVDGLSAMLLHRAEEEDRQVFMVSSAVAGEGKSTVACQLAQSLSSMGKRVALVDFDLRRPSIHHYLNLDGAPGVREVLSGQIPWQQAVQTRSSDNLDVITSGAPTSRLRETINGGSVAELLSHLRSNYDLIIVDSSPILPVVDARLLGKFCDAVILTLVRDVSRIPMATQACEVLRSYGIHVFGTVVIGGKQSVYSKYYGDAETDKEKTKKSKKEARLEGVSKE